MFDSNRAVKRYFKRHSFSSFELNDRQADLVCKFTLHHGAKCPVNADAFVVYRTVTIAPDGREIYSHIHAPVKAGLMNWGRPEYGRIHDYMVVETKDLDFFKQDIEGITPKRKKVLADKERYFWMLRENERG